MLCSQIIKMLRKMLKECTLQLSTILLNDMVKRFKIMRCSRFRHVMIVSMSEIVSNRNTTF